MFILAVMVKGTQCLLPHQGKTHRFCCINSSGSPGESISSGIVLFDGFQVDCLKNIDFFRFIDACLNMHKPRSTAGHAKVVEFANSFDGSGVFINSIVPIKKIHKGGAIVN